MSRLFFHSEATRLQRRLENLQLFEDFFSRTLRLVGAILALWLLLTLTADAGPLDWLQPGKAAAKIDTIENIAFDVGGALAMLAALFILRKLAMIISAHWKLTVAIAAIIVAVVALTGCSSDHHVTVKNDSQKSVLKYTLPDDTKVELDLMNGITPETLISLNTALANSQVQALSYSRQQHAEATRQQIFDLTRFGAVLLVFVALFGGGVGFIMALVLKKKGVTL